jgi:hypothetical protein
MDRATRVNSTVAIVVTVSRKAVWVAFNLPVGRVIAPIRHHRDVDDHYRVYDLRDQTN